MRRKRSSRGTWPVCSRTIRSTRSRSPSTLSPSAASASGSRCVCTESTSGTDSTIARSTSVATSWASSSGSSPGSLRCSETSVEPPTRSDAQVVDLAHARDPLRRGQRPLAQGGLVLLRLDVDDDVAVGQRPVHRVLDRVRRGVALADRRARRDGDHDVRELLPRGLAHPQAPQLDPGQRPDRGQRRLLRVGRDPVHQDVDVDAHQPSRGEQHEPGHEQRRRRVGPVVALARGDEAEQHGRRAGEVAREVERVRLQRRALVAAAGAVRDGRSHGVDDDHRRRPRAAPSRVGRPGRWQARTGARAHARRSAGWRPPGSRPRRARPGARPCRGRRRGRDRLGGSPRRARRRSGSPRRGRCPSGPPPRAGRGCSWRSRPGA